MTKNVRILSVVIASIVLIVGTYLAYEKYTRRTHVVAMVNDTAVRLRTTLQAQTPGSAGADVSAAAANAHLATLRKMNASSFRPLADAADDYLVTAREILRRAGDIHSAHSRSRASVDALNAHVGSDRGRADWIKDAAQLKATLDKDARDYRIAVESYVSLLKTFPASQTKMAPHLEPEAVIDELTLENARKGALDAFAVADQNIRQAVSLGR